MINTSPEFQEAVSGPHIAKGRLDVEVLGSVVDMLYPSDCTVNVDSQQSIRRSVTTKFLDETGKYTPQGAADRFNPTSGTVLRPYSGVEIQSVERISVVMNTQEDWDTGTFTDVVSNPDGSISL